MTEKYTESVGDVKVNQLRWHSPTKLEFRDSRGGVGMTFEFDDRIMSRLKNDEYDAIGELVRDFAYKLAGTIAQRDVFWGVVNVPLKDVLEEIRDKIREANDWIPNSLMMGQRED